MPNDDRHRRSVYSIRSHTLETHLQLYCSVDVLFSVLSPFSPLCLHGGPTPLKVCSTHTRCTQANTQPVPVIRCDTDPQFKRFKFPWFSQLLPLKKLKPQKILPIFFIRFYQFPRQKFKFSLHIDIFPIYFLIVDPINPPNAPPIFFYTSKPPRKCPPAHSWIKKLHFLSRSWHFPRFVTFGYKIQYTRIFI